MNKEEKKAFMKLASDSGLCPETMSDDECDDPDREGDCPECWSKYLETLAD